MKQFESGRKLNEKIMSGVNKLADAVGTTLGPKIVTGKHQPNLSLQ